MGKNTKKKRPPPPTEDKLHIELDPAFSLDPDALPLIVDTHTHLASTFSEYRRVYSSGEYDSIHDFVKGFYGPTSAHRGVRTLVDVWCEAPVQHVWKEIADSALTREQRLENWGGLEYWFVMGVHPHHAKDYTEEVEATLLDAMTHERCIGWGEMGLDYHYNFSPPEKQQQVFLRQLKHAVRLGKSLTIHTREADQDIERILKAEVPKDHKIHIHCFTDNPQLAKNLLDHFPHLYIGITGVITYATNENTSAVIKHLVETQSPLRILLETDAPYMTPAQLNKGQRLPFSHSGMIPWTAQFVAEVAGGDWTVEKVLAASRDNAKAVYGV